MISSFAIFLSRHKLSFIDILNSSISWLTMPISSLTFLRSLWSILAILKKKCIQLFSKLDNRKIIDKFNKIELNNINLRYKESNFDITIPNMIINIGDKISITGKSGQYNSKCKRYNY